MFSLLISGSYFRFLGLDSLIRQFISLFPNEAQVVNLGAGFDTRYLNYKKDPNIRFKAFYEIDFPHIISSKKYILSSIKDFSKAINDYFLIPGDLNDWQSIVEKLFECGFNPKLPTIFISECVLIYLECKFSDEIIKWSSLFTNISMFIAFEQILPNDAFGKVMLRNLKVRNIHLLGLHDYPTLEAQKQRYLTLGYEKCKSVDLNFVEDSLSNEERARISKLEMMDEFEEARLLSKHYCITWAVKGIEKIFELKLQ